MDYPCLDCKYKHAYCTASCEVYGDYINSRKDTITHFRTVFEGKIEDEEKSNENI